MIFLDSEETRYLLDLLEKHGDKEWWAHGHIEQKIKDDVERKQNIAICDHVYARYSGVKHCCARCGARSEGMGETWYMEEKVDPEDFKKAEIKTPIEEALGI